MAQGKSLASCDGAIQADLRGIWGGRVSAEKVEVSSARD
jgi:hypothetical protein